MPEHVVTLTVNGTKHEGWKTVRINRGVEQISGAFSLEVTERWPKQPEKREIPEGARCTVAIDGEVVITGYVDDVEVSYDQETHSVRVSGRDATGDLVDCSAIHKPGEWHDRTLEQIAADICAPFGVKLRTEVNTGKAFADFTLQKGETAFEAIQRMCRARGVLAMADGRGALVICRSGTQRFGKLVEGKGGNIKNAEAKRSWRDRFSEYRVTGQAPGTEWGTPGEAAGVSAIARDHGVTRYRPMLIVADLAEGVSFADQANWHARTREAKSKPATFTVQGWAFKGGLWHPNRLVPVHAPVAKVVGDRLIASIDQTLTEKEGELTKISLVGAGAFDVLPVPETKGGAW